MSKATRLAGALDGFADALPVYGFEVKPLRNAAAHLRALEANRQMLVETLEALTIAAERNGFSPLHAVLLNAKDALEQAKELT